MRLVDPPVEQTCAMLGSLPEALSAGHAAGLPLAHLLMLARHTRYMRFWRTLSKAGSSRRTLTLLSFR